MGTAPSRHAARPHPTPLRAQLAAAVKHEKEGDIERLNAVLRKEREEDEKARPVTIARTFTLEAIHY